MPQPRPELIIVAGPQQGDRAVLMDNVAFLGRSAECNVQINEPAVSRKQIKFTLAPGGWVVENIAATPLRINGKKHKMGRKVFLETGDVLGVGTETKILFVSPDADPEEALLQYRQKHGVADVPAEPPPLVAAPAPAGQGANIAAPLAAPTPIAAVVEPEQVIEPEEAAEPDRPLNAADMIDAERKAKIKKYCVLFGIYIVVLVIGMAVLYLLLGKEPDKVKKTGGVPQRLTGKQIKDTLSREVEPLGNYPALAQEHLDRARRFYVNRSKRGNLYWCVENYKLYLAYGGLDGLEAFSVEDETRYNDALLKLIENVSLFYQNAYAYGKESDWGMCRDAFEEVLSRVPAATPGMGPEPDSRNAIFANVQKNLSYLRRKAAKTRR